MNEVMTSSTESPAGETRRWIGRFLIAVVLGEAIWGFLVSVTNNLAVPAMARVLGGDPQSPLYLGRGDINVPPLFGSVLELFFAGIVAVFLNAWTQRPGRTRVVRQVVTAPRPVAVPSPAPAPVPAPAAAVVSPPPVAAPAVPSPPTYAAPPTEAAIPPAAASTEPVPSPEKRSPQPVPAEKPKKPKKVYYNIVGEAIESDDE